MKIVSKLLNNYDENPWDILGHKKKPNKIFRTIESISSKLPKVIVKSKKMVKIYLEKLGKFPKHFNCCV